MAKTPTKPSGSPAWQPQREKEYECRPARPDADHGRGLGGAAHVRRPHASRGRADGRPRAARHRLVPHGHQRPARRRLSERRPINAVSRLADPRGSPSPHRGSRPLSPPDPQHQLFLGHAIDPRRSLRLARADHGGELASTRRPGSPTGRRSQLAAFHLRPAQHSAHLHRKRPPRLGRGRRSPAILDRMVFLHALPMGRVRHGLVRAGKVLGPSAGGPLADRRWKPPAHRPHHSHARRRSRRRGPLRRQHPL